MRIVPLKESYEHIWNRQDEHQKESDVKKDETVVPSNEDVNVDEVMRKYDRESNTRIWQGVPKACHNFGNGSVFGLLPAYDVVQRQQAETRLARFLAFVIVIGYLMYPVKKTGHSPQPYPVVRHRSHGGRCWVVRVLLG